MIQLLRGNSSTLNASQQIFAEGQPIFEKDTQKLKIGNGVDIYSALKYIGESGGSSPSMLQKYSIHSILTHGDIIEVFLFFLTISDTRDVIGTPNTTEGKSWQRVTEGVYYLADRYTNGASISYSIQDTVEYCCSGFDASNITWIDTSVMCQDVTATPWASVIPMYSGNICMYWIETDDDNTPPDPNDIVFSLRARGIRTS